MEKKWNIVIINKMSLLSIDISEVCQNGDLLVIILGPLWFVIQLVFTTIMFMFVSGGIAGISTDGILQAVFYLAGLVCWNYFQNTDFIHTQHG